MGGSGVSGKAQRSFGVSVPGRPSQRSFPVEGKRERALYRAMMMVGVTEKPFSLKSEERGWVFTSISKNQGRGWTRKTVRGVLYSLEQVAFKGG